MMSNDQTLTQLVLKAWTRGEVEPVKQGPLRFLSWSSLGLLTISLFFSSSVPYAHAAPCEYGAPAINILFENDLWGSGKDSHYTHGSRISYVSRKKDVQCEESGSLPGIVRRSLAVFSPEFFGLETRRVNFILGQNIFTPEDISRNPPDATDRPYAGWLYLGIGLIKEKNGIANIFEIDLGVVGSASLADKVQRGWHNTIHSPRPLGWDHQLENELGILINYERKWLMTPKTIMKHIKFDFTPSLGFALGNVYTYASTGAMFRIGYNLPHDFGPPRIRPGAQGSDFSDQTDNISGYLFSGVEGRAVAHNIFLDGNTFKDSPRVDKRDFVGDIQVGFVVHYRHVRFSISNIFRSKEFHGQHEADEFGAVSLAYFFGGNP